MFRFAVRRLAEVVVVTLGAVTLVFFVLRTVGDPARLLLAPEASAQDLQRLRTLLGLNEPLAWQYVHFLRDLVTGHLGNSFRSYQPVVSLVLERVPATALLAAATLAIAVPVGLALGVVGGVRPNSVIDQIASVLAVAGRSMPSFWLGIVLIIVFAVHWNWLPPSGYGDVKSVVLPSVTLAMILIASISRLTRAHMIEALATDYVRTARAKGASECRVIVRHGLRNVLIPVVTLMGLQIGRLLGGAIIVETVFAWPGVGNLLVNAILNLDFPVVQATALLVTLAVVLANLGVDMVYALLDPRVRFE